MHLFKEWRFLIETLSFKKCLRNYGLLRFAFLFPQSVELFLCKGMLNEGIAESHVLGEGFLIFYISKYIV